MTVAPWAAWIVVAAAAALAAWLFRLKVRPPRVAAPSLLIWRHVLDETRERSWWERIRRAVSLAVTVGIAMALALAFARPAPSGAGRTAGRLLLVLDSSWSMRAAVAGGGTRWDRAVAEARAVAGRAGRDDILLATTGEGLVEGPTADLSLIDAALDQLSPSGADGAVWPNVRGAGDSVHFFTDGAVVRSIDRAVVVHSVYEPAPNVAITAFAARPATAASAPAEAYLEVGNYAAAAQPVRVTVTDGATVVLDKSISMAAGEAIRQVLPLPPHGAARLRARVSAAANALDIDDEAVAWLAAADPLRVEIVSDDPAGIAAVLQRDAGLQVTGVRPGAFGAAGQADVVVFDGWLPAEAPALPFIAFDPPSRSWLGTAAAEEATPTWTTAVEHAVLGGVDARTIALPRARGYVGAALTPVAVSAGGTPIVSIADSPQRRAVVAGFSLRDSNAALTSALPLFVANAVEWLGRPVGTRVEAPGLVTLPASTTRVVSPSGRPVPIVAAADRAIATLTDPGLYLVDVGGSRGVIAVNAGDPDVSNLRRTSMPGSAGTGPGASVGAGAGRPWWIYAAWAALTLAVVEWWTWQRRVTV